MTNVYRWAWLSLAAGLALMISRRLIPAYEVYSTGRYIATDALAAFLISALLAIGVLGIKRFLEKEGAENSALSLLLASDPLTQCLSRPEILYKTSSEIERTLRTGNTFALLELDIDHFKDINDLYGHQVGDEILISLVRCIQQTLRNVDSLGRIGGEEFLVLLPETDKAEAIDTAERIRKHIANTLHITSYKDPLSITVSIGVTTFEISKSLSSNKAELLTELVKKADDAMYQAKNSGRNCCQML
ncbi:GGDEF domain-containing protein [Polynucleobacter sp. MWH-Berg-3C6]|uniref:GGDEF domain-containing protein n=1 Tax=Polynucleobacter sp. MWH-Berg-3C6 TaxID=1855882 RepID=UPI001C0DE38B|nr:GGDEF domain-containing protein [Polynucleobacter sp. MWH-Berg-3C6]MBU3551344.1 GGDEF domain-containing protein [Polynucleobacter sp. MWH-Berg-3C6]